MKHSPQLMASAGLLALALAAPAKGLTVTNYLQPLHYVIPRNCCPSRYAAISAWHQHRRCGARVRRVGGGMSGGGGGGGGVGGAFQVTGVPVVGPPFSVVGPPSGEGGPPPTIAGPPTVETPPPVPIPGPVIGEGVAGLISMMALAAAAVALGRRRRGIRYG